MQTLGDAKNLNDYDESLLRIEMDLFTEWLLGKHLKLELNHEQTGSVEEVFNLLVTNALQQPQVFVHRDFHSRNLMLTKENNPGVIDYQDAVYGPISYDLASLLKDCYIKWSKDEINAWVDVYLDELAARDFDQDFERKEFQR